MKLTGEKNEPESYIALGNPIEIGVSAKASDALPSQIVWMPKGSHSLQAHTVQGGTFEGTVICDEKSFNAVKASFENLKAGGMRVWLDEDHADANATAWVKDFSWDPALGIVCSLEWTARGETALRGKEFYSFSPTFRVDKATNRVAGLLKGHAAGGLVNAPAFGAAMPALIAARMGGNTNPDNTAPGGSPRHPHHIMKDKIIEVLAALKVKHAADASEADLVALFTKHASELEATSAANAAEVVSIKAALAEAKKKADEAEVAAKKADRLAGEKVAELEKKMIELAAVQAAYAAGRSSVDVTSNSTEEVVIRGYSKADGVVAKGVFFNEEIVPLIAKRSTREISRALGVAVRAAFSKARNSKDYADVQAANSLGTLVGNLISQQALALLKYKFPVLANITTDFSNASADFNQTIITRLKTAIAASQYTGAGYTAANAGTTDVSVTLSHHPYAQVAFNANELASTNRDLFGEQAEVVAYAIGLDIVNNLYALFTVGNYPTAALVLGGTGGGTATGSGTGYARQSAIYAAKALFNNKVPEDGRVNLLNADAFGALAADPAVVSLAAYQKPELITGYELPPIAGMATVQVVNLPTTANMVAVALHKRAVVVATRVPNDYTAALPGSNYGNVSQVSDPDTGITFMQTEYVNHDTGAANFRQAVMYGVAVGDPVAAQLVYHS